MNEINRERAILQWLAEGDSGISSEVLALASVGIRGRYGNTPPADRHDCGRCERLAKQCPFVVEALPGLIARHSGWARWEFRIRHAAEAPRDG